MFGQMVYDGSKMAHPHNSGHTLNNIFFIKLYLSGKEEVDVMITNGYPFLIFICYYYMNYETIYLASSI